MEDSIFQFRDAAYMILGPREIESRREVNLIEQS
jgi:hypothetical protein